MKILITGLTPQQCGNGTRHGYRAVVDLYAAALRWAGHTVDHRAWEPGDDLTQYDAAIVGIVPFNSIAARHVYTTCDVIARARRSGCGLVFMVDDWNFHQLRTSVRSLNKDTDRMFTSIKGRTHREWAETGPGREVVDLVMGALDSRPWPVTLFPAFSWGDHSGFRLKGASEVPAKEIVTLDPTVFTDPYPLVKSEPDQRKRSWVMGTLSNQQAWVDSLNLTWDVDYVGSKVSKADRSVKEHELVQMYAESWGVLSAPYKRILGTGWWRNRFVYAARAGAVLLADPAEAPQLGDTFNLSPAGVESLNNGELTELAAAQADALRQHVWPAERLVEELERVLRTAHAETETPAPTALSTAVNAELAAAKAAAAEFTRRLEAARARAAANAVQSYAEEPKTEHDTEPQPIQREYARREERRFDQTALRSDKHGRRVHRDYAAHFFKWGWVTRHVTNEDRVLDVGCGAELPLPRVMELAPKHVPAEYLGVDLNEATDPIDNRWVTFRPGFNFVDGYGDLPACHFTVAACIEVIEHMGVEDGKRLLRGIFHCLAPGGMLYLSTPVFNGKAAANHVHEYTVAELEHLIDETGFTYVDRYGTFASYPDLKRVLPADQLELLDSLRDFYSDEVTACFLAPLYPDASRNNLWVVKKP